MSLDVWFIRRQIESLSAEQRRAKLREILEALPAEWVQEAVEIGQGVVGKLFKIEPLQTAPRQKPTILGAPL